MVLQAYKHKGDEWFLPFLAFFLGYFNREL